jgi:hypothetical protein
MTPELQTVLNDTVQRWVTMYHDDQYVNPLLWAQRGSEVTSLKSLQKDATTPSSRMTMAEAMSKPLHTLEVAMARPMPPPLLPLLGYDDDEVALTDSEHLQVAEYWHAALVWLTPTNLRLMLLPDDEKDDEQATARTREVLQLLRNKALHKPLAPNEQRTVLQVLQATPPDETSTTTTATSDDDGGNEDGNLSPAVRIIQEAGFTAEHLPALVEHNPLVAYECLVHVLMTNESSNIAFSDDFRNDCLSRLIGMDLSLHTMEVVNRLATHHLENHGVTSAAAVAGKRGGGSAAAGTTTTAATVKTPLLSPDYLHLFITSCMASCENVPDRHAQNRLVRLVCVFCQSLLRNQILHVDDIYIEVQAFCVEFSRIREATALFKSLKAGGATGVDG